MRFGLCSSTMRSAPLFSGTEILRRFNGGISRPSQLPEVVVVLRLSKEVLRADGSFSPSINQAQASDSPSSKLLAFLQA